LFLFFSIESATHTGGGFVTTFLKDIRFAARLLLKSPGFFTVAVLTLAIGIGANSAIYSVVSAVLFHPLPYQAPDRLMVVWENNLALELKRVGPSGLNFLDWKKQNTVFEDMVAFDHGSGTVTGLGEPEQVPGMRVTVNFFDFLDTKALIGRTFTPEECRGQHNVGLLSYGYWQRRFGGAPDVIGKTFTIDGLAYTLIGVLPKDFYVPVAADLFAPWPNEWLERMGRHSHELGVIARLKPGVSMAQAQAEMNVIAQRIARQDPSQKGWGATVVPIIEALLEGIRPALLLLSGAVGFVLLIACVNVANLLLSRASAREKEMAVRISLGASRLRIMQQLLSESILVGVISGVAGIILAFWCLDSLRRLIPSRITVPGGAVEVVLPSFGLNGEVLIFTLFLSLLSGLIFGLIPALQASRSRLNETLKEGGRGSAAATAGGRMRSILVVAEVALALVLLTGAGLMVRASRNLADVKPGFQSDQLLTMQIELPTDSKYQRQEEQSAVFYKIQTEVEKVPGVSASGLVECLPLDEFDESRVFEIEGRPPDPSRQGLRAEYRRTSTGYLQAMKIPLLKGREFTQYDNSGAAAVAIIDAALAQRYWPNEDPIGKRLRIRDGVSASTEIVGIAGSVRHFGLNQGIQPMLYVPFLQRPARRMSLVVRSASDGSGMIQAVKEAVWRVDKDQPVYRVRPMNELVSHSVAPQRLILWLLSIFSLLALILASIGTYGVMSYSVTQRTRDIGIRMALGAEKQHVQKMVLRQGLVLILFGIAGGLVAALLLTRFLSSQLFEVSASDPSTFGSVAMLLSLVALLACYLPARRATRIDPIVALRYE
jgi:putative ABC transport system permease protein